MLDIRKTDEINHPIFANQYSNHEAVKNIKPLEIEILCTLTELFNGCKKTLSYYKNVLSHDGQNTQTICETKTI